MSFQIIALAYVLIAGQVAGNEPIVFPHEMSFHSLDACQQYLKGELFAIQKEALADFVRHSVASSFVKSEDGPLGQQVEPPEFGIAITASCEEDKRV